MKFRDFLIHLSILGLATVWEIFLAYQRWLEKYYIRGESIKLWDRIFTCHIWYSPTPIFVILVLLPAIVILALYVYLRSPILKKSGLSIGAPILTVVLMPIFSDETTKWLWGILIVSILSGIVLGEGKLEKVLLAVQGFFPALMVLMIISTGLHVTC
ncbi:hypothetical membrane protein [Thermococcus kodakarensis KOD1]|uniref:Hypothetical membrane protein n=1 Tax=Thermococcus kodakarensis (strain ATCC BAA-918 / JCM 12380 / KOD1) TaxID=69014 RepID=Q5JE81_THEKO|nr:hypothetical protein [Thermococcus kodakarensis]WCN29084.1 hypothetical protein POG15_05745 [Thermococcus kodakarensis]WCN31388.1 hypothetical protein POG21_05745 [Thermococcus kodakarensis]BAD85323.1 hypothetical membrane protein [Thermococcus kodakarensis KOD1]